MFSKQITSPNVTPSTLSGWTRSPGVSSYGICCSAEIHESSSRNGTYSPNGTRCTLRYSPTRLPSRSNSNPSLWKAPSGACTTAPASVGTPTSRMARVTWRRKSVALAPGSSALSPHTARSGGSAASRRCSAMFISATRWSSSNGGRPRARRTSTWTAATSSVRPSAPRMGMSPGERISTSEIPTKAAAEAGLHRARSTASISNPATRTTTKETPHTPVTEARRSRVGSPVWVDPSCPHPNPPTGHIPRSHSWTVHRAASPAIDRSGRSPLHTAGARSPKAAMYAAQARVSAPQASCPNCQIQYRSAPKYATPNASPSSAPRRGRASRTSHRSGTGARNATTPRFAGGRARESRSPESAQIARARERRTAEGFRRSRGRASWPCP